MEEEIAVVVKQLGMEVVDLGNGVADLSGLNAVADPNPVLHVVDLCRRGQVGLLLELLRGLLETL